MRNSLKFVPYGILLVIALVLLSETAQAKESWGRANEKLQTPAQSDTSNHRGKHARHHRRFRLWPFGHRHHRGKNSDHSDHHRRSDKKDKNSTDK